jgi:hypothetical protein
MLFTQLQAMNAALCVRKGDAVTPGRVPSTDSEMPFGKLVCSNLLQHTPLALNAIGNQLRCSNRHFRGGAQYRPMLV